MHRLMFGAAALAAVALQPALAQPQCASPADQSAFEVQALRSELMVLATGCRDDVRYNAIIRRFQADLQGNEAAVNAYFKKHYGRAGQVEHDRFVTDLANALSRQGSQLGGDFCPRNAALFSEVMALRNASELPDYAAAKDLIPPTLTVCTGPATQPAPKAKTKKVITASRH
jgi:hypothetical protein